MDPVQELLIVPGRVQIVPSMGILGTPGHAEKSILGQFRKVLTATY